MRLHGIDIINSQEKVSINGITKSYIIKQIGLDEILLDKSKIFSITNEIKDDKIREVVDKEKTMNPTLGNIKNVKHSIDLIENHPQIRAKPYPIPYGLLEKAKSFVDDLKRQNIVRDSTSSTTSPAFFKIKPNGIELRLLVDYRKLNQNMVIESFPAPSLQDCLAGLSGTTIFSQIDLKSGYYQVLMDPESIPYTSFVLPFGQFEFLRMPFGLANAPRTFQRSMLKLFGQLAYVKIYIDDILFASRTLQEHRDHVQTVTNILLDEGISINIEKSNILKDEVKYLDHIISKKELNLTFQD